MKGRKETHSDNTFFMKLHFIGSYSKMSQKKITNLCETFCKGTDVKLVFSSTKISCYFSKKITYQVVSNLMC